MKILKRVRCIDATVLVLGKEYEVIEEYKRDDDSMYALKDIGGGWLAWRFEVIEDYTSTPEVPETTIVLDSIQVIQPPTVEPFDFDAYNSGKKMS